MKTLLFLFIPFLITVPAPAQTFDEWFRQEHTKEKYLVQQIAALQAYSGTLRQGYALVRDGISTVQQIKNGDFGLHQVYFSSLRQVPPALRELSYVEDILRLQAVLSRAWDPVSLSRAGSQAEYLLQVRAGVLAASARELETLWLVLANDLLALSDGARVQQVEASYRRLLEAYRFTLAFLGEAQTLTRHQAREQQQLARQRALYLPERQEP